MTPVAIETQVRTFVNAMLENGLALASNPVVSSTAEDMTIVSWSRAPSISSTFGRFASLAEYTTFLDHRDFNLVLLDGALLQIAYTFKGRDLVGHRLCHYPCPIDISDLEADDGSITEWMEALDATELRERLRLRTPLRLDFDLRAEKKDHPASHFTISEETCRIPVAAPISLGHFVKLVFSQFYPAAWMAYDFLRKVSHHQWDDTLRETETNEMYLSWRRNAPPPLSTPPSRGR